MISLPFVRWDRFHERDNGIAVFGWIDREDLYKDFVSLDYNYDSKESKITRKKTWSMGYLTSSQKYSKEIGRILTQGSDHSDCKRVEDYFKEVNCIKQ